MPGGNCRSWVCDIAVTWLIAMAMLAPGWKKILMTAMSQTQLRQFPPGTTPPFIMQYSASTVPILQLGLSGQGLSEQRLFDLGANFIRVQLADVEGAAIPWPYGGKQRQVQVDLNTAALQAKGLSPADVVSAISTQNLILPPGLPK